MKDVYGLSSFEELPERDNSVSVHNRNIPCQSIELYTVSMDNKNIQCLAIELYKVFNYISPDIMKYVFSLSTSSNYSIRSRRTFTIRSVKTVYYRTESLSYLAPKVWKLIPNKIKSLENLPKFKKAIKK